jgi:hypothetical protein
MVQKIQIKVLLLLLLFFVFFLNNIILFILKVNKKSKLHLFDIGKLNSTKLTQLNHTIMSTLNGQKHCIVSNTDSKLIHLMRETMCSSTQCRITMIAHINNKNDPDHLNENLKIIQLSAKLQKNSERFMKQQRVYKVIISL